MSVEEPAELLFDNNVDRNGARTVRVLHCVWKALRKLRFLTYLDENDEVQETTVDENYPPQMGSYRGLTGSLRCTRPGR